MVVDVLGDLVSPRSSHDSIAPHVGEGQNLEGFAYGHSMCKALGAD